MVVQTPFSQHLVWNLAESLAFVLPSAKSVCYTSPAEQLVPQYVRFYLLFAPEKASGLRADQHRGQPRSGRFPRLCRCSPPLPAALPRPLLLLSSQPRSGERPVKAVGTPARRNALETPEGEIAVEPSAAEAPCQPQTRFRRAAASPPPANWPKWGLPTQEKGVRCRQDFTSGLPLLIHRSAPRTLQRLLRALLLKSCH